MELSRTNEIARVFLVKLIKTVYESFYLISKHPEFAEIILHF